MSEKLGVTQEYNAENRQELWDSAEGKAAYKDKTFGDRQTCVDPITGNTLHKSQKAAQNKYHMRNADGERVSTAWAAHAAETDHIVSVKAVHDAAKHNPFLSDADVREVVNSEENYRVLPKSMNASKGEKSDWALITDAGNGLSLQGRAHMAGEKIQADAALHTKFAGKTLKNAAGVSAEGALESLDGSKMAIISSGVEHMVNVALGEETVEDAVVDLGRQTAEIAVSGAVEKLGTEALKQIPVLGELAGSGAVGQLITAATIVAESASRLIDGEITADAFMEEIGDKGATIIAQMIGSEVGAFAGAIIGSAVSPVIGTEVGAVVGRMIGTMVATVACSAVIAIRRTVIASFKTLDDYKRHEQAVRRLEREAVAEMERQRERFRSIAEAELRKWDDTIERGFERMIEAACRETYDLYGITDGLDTILSAFGKTVMFRDLDAYEAQLDMPLRLHF